MVLRIENKLPTAVLAISVAVVSYLAARLGGVLALGPQEASALWPGNALLVSVLLLVPRRTWPVLVPAGLANSFDGVPRLNTLKALAKYSLFLILIGPFIGSFVGAFALPGFYLTDWRIFFSRKRSRFLL